MKNVLFLLVLALIFSLNAKSQTPGQLSITVTSLPNGKSFSPKHVLAIWVETESGTFVKTLKLNASARKEYLYSWIASSSQNTTDAITGSTLNSHITHIVNWDGTNVNGALVNDGNYKVIIEYTSEHAQGPKASFTFNKSDSQVSLQPSDETYFQNISLSFTPDGATGISNINTSIAGSLALYPNPVSDHLNISFQSAAFEKDISIGLYDVRMRLIKTLYKGYAEEGLNHFNFNLSSSEIIPGNYFIIISDPHSLLAKGMIKE